MMESKQETMISKMKEILQERYLQLHVSSYTVREQLDEERCLLTCVIHNQDHEPMNVEGEGVGTIDALFNGLRTMLADQYPSLNSIRFSDFNVRGLMSTDDRQAHNTRAQAEATVSIRNSEGKEFVFKSTARSVSLASIQAVVLATEYFVNSERTFVSLHEIVQHYRGQNRHELVQKYTGLMSEVVENTSYSEVVEGIRGKMR